MLKATVSIALVVAWFAAAEAAASCPGPHQEVECTKGDAGHTCVVQVRIERDRVCFLNGDSVTTHQDDMIVWQIEKVVPGDERTVEFEAFKQFVENKPDAAKPSSVAAPCAFGVRGPDRFECRISVVLSEGAPDQIFKYQVAVKHPSSGVVDLVTGEVRNRGGKRP